MAAGLRSERAKFMGAGSVTVDGDAEDAEMSVDEDSIGVVEDVGIISVVDGVSVTNAVTTTVVEACGVDRAASDVVAAAVATGGTTVTETPFTVCTIPWPAQYPSAYVAPILKSVTVQLIDRQVVSD